MEEEITKLIDGCLEYFKNNSYSGNRIQTYESLWRNGILPYMTKNYLTIYTPEVGQQFVESITCDKLEGCQYREKIRSIQVLDEFLTLRHIRTRRTIPVEHPLFGEIGEQMQKHIEHLQHLRRSMITIKRYRIYLNRFLVYLTKCEIKDVREISERYLLDFLSSSGTNNSHVITTLRVLFNFWFEKGITNNNLADSLEQCKSKKREKIPSFYSKEEVCEIEKAFDRASGFGKRNYAMFMLASRLGLRASDISGLKFSNIDWEVSEIHLRQQKTGNPLSLPLLTDVGNAIIDYLRYGRPNSESQNIFLAHRPPFKNATSLTVTTVISNAILKSGISIDGRHHGSHSLRHSLASRLLELETNIPVISEVLGHSSSQTTMIYLKIDISSLMKCAIPVSNVSNDFYTQKGGVFYE